MFSVGRWTFGVCFLLPFDDISRPNEPSDYFAAGALRARIRAHGAGDPDAAAKERRLGCGIWRRGDGKYLRRADDERPGKIHHLAGRHFFRADVCLVDS